MEMYLSLRPTCLYVRHVLFVLDVIRYAATKWGVIEVSLL